MFGLVRCKISGPSQQERAIMVVLQVWSAVKLAALRNRLTTIGVEEHGLVRCKISGPSQPL